MKYLTFVLVLFVFGAIGIIQTGYAQSETSQAKADIEEWITPKNDTVSVFSGTLQYDAIPSDFKCDYSPKINYQYVDKSIKPKYPDNDSLFVRIGGENTAQDFEIVFSLRNEQDSAYAKDLSYHIILKNQDGTPRMSAIYSPDAYSDYSTLGVMVEANSKTSKDGTIPSDIEKKFVDLFGHSYIVPVLMPPNGNYDLYVRVFDSENDWVYADTCGIQAVIPISANGEDDVTIGKIQFSDILVSATETNHENLEATQKIIADAVEKRNNDAMASKNTKPDTDEPRHLSPLRQLNGGVQIDKITCKQGLELVFKDSNNSPSCVSLQTKLKLAERGWTKPKQIATEISSETRLELVGFLENGQVSEFNAMRKDIVGFLFLEGVDASGIDLSGINLENVILPDIDLRNAKLEGAKLHNAKLLQAKLQNLNLENLDLSGASLQLADLEGVNLRGANLEGASLMDTFLIKVKLENANLKNANLRHAVLENADLRGANLQGANLDGATLQNADLKNALLKEAQFYNTNLEGVKNFPIDIEKAKAGGIMLEN